MAGSININGQKLKEAKKLLDELETIAQQNDATPLKDRLLKKLGSIGVATDKQKETLDALVSIAKAGQHNFATIYAKHDSNLRHDRDNPDWYASEEIISLLNLLKNNSSQKQNVKIPALPSAFSKGKLHLEGSIKDPNIDLPPELTGINPAKCNKDDILFIPVNTDNHWCMLAIKITGKGEGGKITGAQAVFVDPYGDKKVLTNTVIRQAVAKALGITTDKVIPAKSTVKLQEVEDSTSCGPWSVAVAEQLAKKWPTSLTSAKSIKEANGNSTNVDNALKDITGKDITALKTTQMLSWLQDAAGGKESLTTIAAKAAAGKGASTSPTPKAPTTEAKLIKLISNNKNNNLTSFTQAFNNLQQNEQRQQLSTLLHTAAKNGQPGIAAYLIEKGADVNTQSLKDSKETPLHSVLYSSAQQEDRESHIATAKLLIENGANVNAQDTKGNTPLHIAVATGNEAIARELIEKGSDKTKKNNKEETPLDMLEKRKNAAGISSLTELLAKDRKIGTQINLRLRKNPGYQRFRQTLQDAGIDFVNLVNDFPASSKYADASNSLGRMNALNSDLEKILDPSPAIRKAAQNNLRKSGNTNRESLLSIATLADHIYGNIVIDKIYERKEAMAAQVKELIEHTKAPYNENNNYNKAISSQLADLYTKHSEEIKALLGRKTDLFTKRKELKDLLKEANASIKDDLTEIKKLRKEKNDLENDIYEANKAIATSYAKATLAFTGLGAIAYAAAAISSATAVALPLLPIALSIGAAVLLLAGVTGAWSTSRRSEERDESKEELAFTNDCLKEQKQYLKEHNLDKKQAKSDVINYERNVFKPENEALSTQIDIKNSAYEGIRSTLLSTLKETQRQIDDNISQTEKNVSNIFKQQSKLDKIIDKLSEGGNVRTSKSTVTPPPNKSKEKGNAPSK